MAFEDENHILRIISALWSRAPSGKAAVLVGAGFSFNAVPLRASQSAMPGWTALVERMILELNPGEDEATRERRAWLKGAAGATSAALRLAQEYESEFGREGLDRLISENVPDIAFGPGEPHRMLMELPWADVLTTNWDTLLERAAVDLEDRVYSVVRTAEDIPGAPGPRIVKLHGSLPSHRPFIFTEEDFRTFPERFAAFLNLARQATMENVLVLIGFSGDDPNFLYWSGWVRDQLGVNAPTIYLVGALELTASQRKMLERRNVRPIDLSRLSDYREWPERDRKGLATRWFLERLTAARPYRRSRWPKVVAPGLTRLALVPRTSDVQAPLRYPYPAGDDWTPETVESVILPLLDHNRRLYPGWVVPGYVGREHLWTFLQQAIPYARRVLPALAPKTALALAFEMNWLCETALIPLFADLSTPFAELIDRLDDVELTADERDRALEIRLALLRCAREMGEANLFTERETWLLNQPLQAEQANRLHYERCLFSRDGLDYDRLDALLADWHPEGDPFWLVRKAALLGENDNGDEARRLSREALQAVRQRTDKDSEDLASWSRESWARLLRWTCLASELHDLSQNKTERDDFTDRLQILASRGCDANGEFDWFRTEMGHTPPRIMPESERIRGFDIGNVIESRNWSSTGPVIKLIAALQTLRFLDETGTPARIAPVTVAATLLTGAAAWLGALDANRAVSALVRAADMKAVNRSLTREAVAALTDEEADVWCERLLTGGRGLSSRARSPLMARSAEGRLAVVVEMLSRLVARRPSFAPAALELAVSLADPSSYRLVVDKPLQNLFRRAFEVLPDEQRQSWAAAVLSIEPPDLNSTRSDPGGAIFASRVRLVPGPELEPIVASHLQLMQRADRRWHASLRLLQLRDAGGLSPDDVTALQAALWDPAFVREGLPTGAAIRRWAVAGLGGVPAGEDPLAALRAWLAALPNLDDPELSIEIHGALGDGGAKLKLKAPEIAALLRLFLKKAAKPADDDPLPLLSDRAKPDFNFWLAFALVVKQGVAFAGPKRMLADYLAAPYPSETAIAVAELLRVGLLTAVQAEALLTRGWTEGAEALTCVCAVHGAWSLLDRPAVAPFPASIWSIAADAVVARTPGGLIASMDFFNRAYARHAAEIPGEIDRRLRRALAALLTATEFTESRAALQYDPGLARRRGAALVKAMAAAGRGDLDVEEMWRVARETQPLREIDDTVNETDGEAGQD